MPTAQQAAQAGIQVSPNIPPGMEVVIHNPPGAPAFALPADIPGTPGIPAMPTGTDIPPGGGAGAGGTGTIPPEYPVGSPEWWELRDRPWAAYAQKLGLWGRPTAGYSPFEQYQAGQYEPLSGMYGMQSALSAMPGVPGAAPNPFMTQWMQPYQSPSGMYGLAKGLLGSAMQMPYSQREQVPGMYGQDIAGLLQYGLRSQLGPGAKWLGGRVEPEYQQWEQQYPEWVTGGGQPSFLDYMKTKYNLGQYF